MDNTFITNRIVWLIVFTAGVVMLIYGFSASQSFTSDISRFFNGTPTDRSMWLIIVGAVLVVIGLSGLAWKRQ